MRTKLLLHPDSRAVAVSAVEADVQRLGDNTLRLNYRLIGDTGSLRFPRVASAERKDELWRHTCFEAFLQAPPQAGYCEFNLAPSTEWASYRFETYRNRRQNLEIGAPRIEVRSDAGHFELSATISMSVASGLAGDANWKLGIAAVVEETNGNLSYWALAHPPGKPNFHCADCFALTFPSTSFP